mgnify:CR=1 FL=1
MPRAIIKINNIRISILARVRIRIEITKPIIAIINLIIRFNCWRRYLRKKIRFFNIR